MDKKNVIGSLANARKRKPSKKLVDTIRKETFQNAYPDQITEKEDNGVKNDEAASIAPQVQSEDEEKADVQNSQEVEQEKRDIDVIEQEKPAQTTANAADKKSKRGRKKKDLPDGPNEFTTLNCTQVTLNRAKIISALTKTPMYQFVDEAIDHYIKYLKKNDKLNLEL